MAKYLRVTGKILSRDSYREERWDPEKQKNIQTCVYTMRVEYAVGGKIYTHSFTGGDIRGEVGGDYEVFYRADDPEKVRSAADAEKESGQRLRMLLIGAVVILAVLAAALFLFPGSVNAGSRLI